jgi:hypothetical protein
MADSSADRVRRYRERQRQERARAEAAGEPEAPGLEPEPDDEQALRDRLGYSESERRTEAERGEAARRMVAANLDPVALPPDIEAVWGRGRVDGTGCLAASTARCLITEWGEDGFRRSALHRAALAEEHHQLLQAEARARFLRLRAGSDRG